MSKPVSSLDVFLGSIMDQESDSCDDCVIEMVIKAMLTGTRNSFYFQNLLLSYGEKQILWGEEKCN